MWRGVFRSPRGFGLWQSSAAFIPVAQFQSGRGLPQFTMVPRRTIIPFLSGLVALMCATQVFSAETGAPRLLTISPAGGKVGSTFDVVVTGDLSGLKEIHFSRPGITATLKETNRFAAAV